MKSYQFTHDGKTYEARAVNTATGWVVHILIDGMPANGLSYRVDRETESDARRSLPESIVDGLMKLAEDDLRRGLSAELRDAETETDEELADRVNRFGR